MDKQEIQAYWNLSRVIKTIPEDAFKKDPQAMQLDQTYNILENMYFKYLADCNERKDNGQRTK